MSVNAEQVSLRHIRDVEDGVLRRFICGRQQLDDFLHEDARDYDAHGLTRTVLVFLEGKRGKATAGSKKQRNCSYVQGPVSVITPSDQRQGLMVACPKVNWSALLIGVRSRSVCPTKPPSGGLVFASELVCVAFGAVRQKACQDC